MKILYYSQHVLGMGHFFRTLEICRHLTAHDVVLVVGGSLPSDMPFPKNIRWVFLPSLMMDSGFSRLMAGHGQTGDVSDIQEMRRKMLWETFRQERPDVFLVELYPFGRKAFRFELDPILEAIENGELPSCVVCCSVRDILVEKSDPVSYEKRVIEALNRWFDVVFVHSDPDWISLDETFSRIKGIAIPIRYTGFVAEQPEPDCRVYCRRLLGVGDRDRLVVVSAGGGQVGGDLCECAVGAFRYLDAADGWRGIVFTGPFLEENRFQSIRQNAPAHVTVERFTPSFLKTLCASDISISMAGYNTCMNILATGVKALVLPFSQNREQGMRARKFAEKGFVGILSEADLQPDRMAERLFAAIRSWPDRAAPPRLDGGSETRRWIEALGREKATPTDTFAKRQEVSAESRGERETFFHAAKKLSRPSS